VDTVGVPVAVVEPVDLAVVPARREHALPGAAALAVGPTTAVDVGAVGRECVDGTVRRPVADVLVDLEGQTGAGDGVDHAEPVAGVARPVQGGEPTADGDLRPLRVDGDGVDDAPGGLRCRSEE